MRSWQDWEYCIRLHAVTETMAGPHGVAFRAPFEGKLAWFVCIPQIEYMAGPFGTRAKVAKLLGITAGEKKTEG